MQNTKSAAAAISMINLMVRPPCTIAVSRLSSHDSTEIRRQMPRNRPGPCIKTYQRGAQQLPGRFRLCGKARILLLVSGAGMDALQEQSFAGSFPVPSQPIDELALSEIKGAILAK